jgi:hypothetical protein
MEDIKKKKTGKLSRIKESAYLPAAVSSFHMMTGYRVNISHYTLNIIICICFNLSKVLLMLNCVVQVYITHF